MDLISWISPKVIPRLRSGLAGAIFGFGVSVLANQVSLTFGLLACALGIAVWLYDSWSYRGVAKRLVASFVVFVVLAILIVVIPTIPWPWGIATLYYADKPLDGVPITLATKNPDRRFCSVMHTWPTGRTGEEHDSFIVCGIWMDKPDYNAKYAEFYLEFSEKVDRESGDCSLSPEPPKSSVYKVGFICRMWTGGISTQSRWYLPMFHGSPIPKPDTQVRISFPYDKSRVAEAKFMLRPPAPER